MTKLPSILMYALLAIAFVVVCLCYFLPSGTIVATSGEEMGDPHVSLLLVFIYIEAIIAIVVTLISAVMSFSVSFKNDPKGAIFGLLGVVAIFLLMGITYALGSGEHMNIIGYEGTENEGSAAKMADMFIWTSVVLTVLAVLAIIVSPIAKKLK